MAGSKKDFSGIPTRSKTPPKSLEELMGDTDPGLSQAVTPQSLAALAPMVEDKPTRKPRKNLSDKWGNSTPQ